MSTRTLPQPQRTAPRRCSCGRFAAKAQAAQPDLFARSKRLAEVDPDMRALESERARFLRQQDLRGVAAVEARMRARVHEHLQAGRG